MPNSTGQLLADADCAEAGMMIEVPGSLHTMDVNVNKVPCLAANCLQPGCLGYGRSLAVWVLQVKQARLQNKQFQVLAWKCTERQLQIEKRHRAHRHMTIELNLAKQGHELEYIAETNSEVCG